MSRIPYWKSFLGILVVAALGVGGFFLYRHLFPEKSPPLAETSSERLGRLSSFRKVHSDKPPTSVAALGRLTPQGEIIDIGGLMGDRLGELRVAENDWVEQGAILGQLESHRERKAERDALAAQLGEAKERLAAELAYCDALIRKAEVAVRQAEEIAPLDVQAQEAKVRLLQTELTTVQTDQERLRSVTAPGAVSPQTLDQHTQLVRRAQQELIAAEANLTKARHAESIGREQAQAELVAARAGRRKAEVAVQIESLTKNLALADVRLERTILRAPRAGRVFKVKSRPGERVDQKPILQLGDTRVMYAVTEVYETDVLSVQPGQQAHIYSAALPKVVGGVVERVGRTIAKNDILNVDPAADADARVVEVWVRLESAELAGRLTNLQVDVVIAMGGAGTPVQSTRLTKTDAATP